MKEDPSSPEHAVLTYVPLSDDEFGRRNERFSLTQLEHRIIAAIEDAGVGEHDGHEVGGGTFVLYSYGPDADQLWEVIARVLREVDLPRGVYAIKRYGEPDDPAAGEERVGVT